MKPSKLASLAFAAIVAASSAPPVALARGGASPRPASPSVTSISLDFSTAIKTTFYSDGSVYEESFDPVRMRRLATKPGTDPR